MIYNKTIVTMESVNIQLGNSCFAKFKLNKIRVGVMVFNATFNNISAISWWSVLLVEETGVPRENNQPAASY